MLYKDINDYHLVELVKENEDVYYGILHDKYQPIIRNIAYNFFKQYSHYGYDLDDFIQEGNFGLYKALKYFDPNKKALFYSFVSLCVNRQLISFVNKFSSKSINYVFIPCDDYNFETLFKVKVDYDDFSFLEDMIKEVILESPLDYACVFELKMNDFTYKEIEELLGYTFSQAEYRFRKLKLVLKDKIEKYLNKETE